MPFPKVICPKMKVIAQLDFELTNEISTGQGFKYITTRHPQNKMHECLKCQTSEIAHSKNWTDNGREVSLGKLKF